ncbi:hypothetical protein DPMN_094361 [Dreissena polymorpha]|uniref:Uncharacterized protein n=1 Tax=Dreissena polymorpha TaxID=45954 RepID=A0A9D4L5W6_DREPO|nr:hypothetical protein DPMN_094361 [Dreissena polymorpha]
MLFRSFHRDNHPLDGLNSGLSSVFARSQAFSSRTGPDTGMSLDLAFVNQVVSATSTSAAFPE